MGSKTEQAKDGAWGLEWLNKYFKVPKKYTYYAICE